MRKILTVWVLLSILQNTSVAMASAEENETTVAIVVASDQNIDELKLATNKLSLIYWRTQLYWPKGQRIKPVNLSTDHPLRLRFSQKILGNLPKHQIDYWNGMYFNGVSPPYAVNSEEAVIRYVTQTTGAIGYIDACLIDNRVKPVFWLMPNGNVVSSKPELNCTN